MSLTACVTPAQTADSDDRPVVITGMQATYSITSALTEGTPIEVVNIPEDGREFAVLRAYIERRKDRFEELFAAASAVVSVTNALPGDPTYRLAREANVSIVNIDAAIPFTYDTPGVGLIDAPLTNVDWGTSDESDGASPATSPWFWLSISNTIRMADIVAGDLSAIFPAHANAIAVNLDEFKVSLLAMRNRYQDQLLAAPDDTVFALADDFVYLTNELALFVDGYFIRQDIEWTDDDLDALTRHLLERDISVVIHKWIPSEEIQASVTAAGAQLVVLETGDQGRFSDDVLATDGLQSILESNLAKLTAALSE
jgi:ABC-type Zn uptake system ZnuABC Zn-binding protein ZnuA